MCILLGPRNISPNASSPARAELDFRSPFALFSAEISRSIGRIQENRFRSSRRLSS